MMKSMYLAAASAFALALLIAPADAKTKRQDKVIVTHQKTTPFTPIPVVGTVVGSTVAFVQAPWPHRVVPYVGYLVCSPFELVGARCY